LLGQVAALGRFFGIVLALVLATQLVVFVLPALTRYLMLLLQSRAQGNDPEPLNIDVLSWVGNSWSLFPLVPVALFIYLVYFSGSWFGGWAALIIALAFAAFFPAMLIVLALTRSPIESMRPRAIYRLIKRCAGRYLIAPTFLVAAVAAAWWVNTVFENDLFTEFVCLYLVFASFAVFGGVIQPFELHREVEIYEPVGPDPGEADQLQVAGRVGVLNHAYGLVSHGNRAGGLDHIYQALAGDRDSLSGWPWFLDQMLQWENTDAALVFAQQYLHQLLHDRNNVVAVKVMLRCRLANQAFKPLPDDRPLALEAAIQCQADDLIGLLR
jgi:hypothetical protein